MSKSKKIAGLMAIAGVSMHLYNKSQYDKAQSKITIRSNETYQWKYGSINYTVAGTGKPILLVHNFTLGSSLKEFEKLEAGLVNEYKVYSLDLLGYGKSDKPKLAYNSILYTELLRDFILEVIGEACTIVSSGESSIPTILLSSMGRDCLDKIVLINPKDIYDTNLLPNVKSKILRFLYSLPILGSFLYNRKSSRLQMENYLKTEGFYDSSKLEESLIDTYVATATDSFFKSKYVYSSYVGNFLNVNPLHILKTLNHPTLIIEGKEIRGGKDIVDNYQYFNNKIEAAYCSRTKNLPHLERPHSVIKKIKDFLN